jgi:hypothetical protein
LTIIGAPSGLLMRIARVNVSSSAQMNADRISGTGNGNSRVRGEFDVVMAPQKNVRVAEKAQRSLKNCNRTGW